MATHLSNFLALSSSHSSSPLFSPPPPPPLSSPKPQTLTLTLALSSLSPSPPPPLFPSPLSINGDHRDPPLPPPPLRLLRLAVRRRDLPVAKVGENGDTRLANALIFAYLNLGRLADARKVFDALPCPDVASFSSMVSAYAKCGVETEAVALFGRMRQIGICPNEFSFVALLTDCIRQSNAELGSQVHAMAIKSHHCCSLHVSNALMGMYVRCGRFDAAVQLFDEMLERDASSWNAILLAMVKESRYSEAFELFHDMQMSGILGDRFSLSTLLTAAVEGLARAEGEAIHAYALKSGLELDLSVGNALMGFYTNFGSIDNVVSVFERMPVRDVISWTSMLRGFMEFGLVVPAMKVFEEMPERNNISYNALLTGLCNNNQGSRCLELFTRMLEDGVGISDFTLTSVVNACAIVSDPRKSEQIHAFVIKSGSKSSAWIDTALVDMYAKCDRIKDAQKVFGNWVHQEGFVIAWTSLLSSYARNGQPEEALSHFSAMLKENEIMFIDEFMLATILGVSGDLGFIELGKQMHCFAVKSRASSDLTAGNAIFTMYAKCGELDDAVNLFDQMPHHDLVSWNALITAHLLHRQGDRVLALWARMKESRIEPDSITFVVIISACRYTSSDSVSTCQQLLLSMESSYNLWPSSEHYAAMIDVLGFWNQFDQVEELLKSIPFEPDALIWRALLNNCRSNATSSLRKRAMQHLLALEPRDPSSYILASNLYSASGRWHCSEKLRQEMREKGLHKLPSRSWTVHENAVHVFYGRDRSHPQSKDIYGGLDVLILECMKRGYEPDTSFVLHEVEEYQKRYFLFYHSAKLAVMYGILMTGPPRAVGVVKNVRLCGDCHSFMKHASSVTGREISVRDATGFHFFRGGECSCRDCW
ncbi:pentatricopeptide repeat-containing protein At5g03800 [Ananas comosus]|uniref:Pentatricopeptide repeat-containing protein At5g03800 n=1 Tax=Ananas comosus TaxID=4615 RepID=A0A6P5FR40_ANACO|nr:pentatricopeptide repeat-containing protein At5g03800 [Ananas comosus]